MHPIHFHHGKSLRVWPPFRPDCKHGPRAALCRILVSVYCDPNVVPLIPVMEI